MSGPSLVKRRREMTAEAWVRGSSAEEIAESIIQIDPLKAAAVGAILMARTGETAGPYLDRAIDRARSDPAGTAARVIKSLIR